jgi:hypothetical protein
MVTKATKSLVGDPLLWPRRLGSALESLAARFERVMRRRFGSLLAVTAAVIVINELALFGLDVRAWDPLYVSAVLLFVLVIRAALELEPRFATMIDRLARRGVLELDPRGLDVLHRRLQERSDRWATHGGLAMAGVVLVTFVVAYRIAERSEVVFTAVATAGGYIAGRAAGRALAFGRFGSWLEGWNLRVSVAPGHVDGAAGLKPVGDFYSFQATLLAIPAFFLAVWWAAIPTVHALQRYDYWRGPYLGLLAVCVAAQIAGFVLPLLSFRRLMRAQKRDLLYEADTMSREIWALQSRLPSTLDQADRNAIQERLALLHNRYAEIEEMPTWPVDKRTRHRFELRNLVLLVPIAGKALSLAPSWQDLVEEVRNIFAA